MMKKIAAIIFAILLTSPANATTPADAQAVVDADINANGTNAITGTVLNSVLTTIISVFSGYAPINSPVFTGSPTAPTVSCGNNTTIATIAYVTNCAAGISSIGLIAPAGGAITVSGSPLVASGSITLNVSGNSGGVPYFASSASMASSLALTANMPVIGGGAGQPPASGSVSGNTTSFASTTGSFINGNCVKTDSNHNLVDSGAVCTTGGTVTTVGFTGGLISVANPTTTPAFTVAGTSGGIPYFASSSTWASSGALTANLPVIGGGAGAAPTVGTRSGNTTKFVTTTGALTNGNCVSIDASGNMIDAGGACTTGGGGGTVSAGTIGQIAQYTGATTVGGVTLVPVVSGGTGSAAPAIVAGAGISVSGSFPNQTVTNTTLGTVTVTGGSPTTGHCTQFSGVTAITDAGSACGSWVLLSTINCSSSGSPWGITTGINSDDLLIAVNNVSISLSNSIGIELSIDNGSSYAASAILISPGGQNTGIYGSYTFTGLKVGHLVGLGLATNTSSLAVPIETTSGIMSIFNPASQINAMRFTNGLGGSCLSGSIVIYKRG